MDNKQADEVEKISYEDIVALYDVEWHENGDLVARHSHEEEERASIPTASQEIASQEEDKYCGVRTDQTPLGRYPASPPSVHLVC